MTIQEALSLADATKDNLMDDARKIAAISEVEAMVHDEIIMKCRHTPEQAVCPKYDTDTDRDTVLLVPDRFARLYVYYILCEIDLQNEEMDKYNNHRALFENKYREFSNYWRREHMPITTAPRFVI